MKKRIKLIFVLMLTTWIIILGCLFFLRVDKDMVNYKLETADMGDTIHIVFIPGYYTAKVIPVGLISIISIFNFIFWTFTMILFKDEIKDLN